MATRRRTTVAPSIQPGVLTSFRRLLEEQRALRLAQLESLQNQSDRSPTGADPVAAFSEFDMEGYDADVVARQLTAAYDALDEIDGALGRIEQGTYGRCSGCATEIPMERLEVLPAARFCVACQRRVARRGG